jgi:general secretion pathway protein G
MTRRRRRQNGFTLVELLVVVLIIGMLATLLAPRMFSGLGEAKSKIARAKMARIEDGLARFQLDCGRLPDESEGGLEALLVAPPDLEEKWKQPYVKRSELLDPWGNPYIYISEGEYNPGSFDLISFGADGQEGGEGENADIVND